MDHTQNLEEMILRSRKAQAAYEQFTQRQVDAIVRAIAKTVYDNAEPLARMAVDETRMGVYEHKVKKNRGKAKIIWHSLKGKPSMGVLRRDEATGITEIARPVGVVGAITPCTNPIVTPMCNAMFALKGRNSIILAPHPRAKKCARAVVDLFLEAIRPLGAPEDLILLLEEPSAESSGLLMRSADVVVATGGMGMVKAAYSSGRPAYGVGAGNVQCILDRGVDYRAAVEKIVEGREFDNGIICSGEQTAIIPKEDYDAVIAEFIRGGCYYIENAAEKEKITSVLFPDGVMNKHLVGRSAAEVAEKAGVGVPEGTRVLLLKADGYGRGDVLSKEKMCPVISAYAYGDFSEAVSIAQANLNVEGRGHSVSIHSESRENIEYAAQVLTVSRVLVNQICSTMNGGSFYNGLAPTTTLGCASWGGNSISENFTYKHLLNVIRVAEYLDGAAVPSDEEIWND